MPCCGRSTPISGGGLTCDVLAPILQFETSLTPPEVELALARISYRHPVFAPAPGHNPMRAQRTNIFVSEKVTLPNAGLVPGSMTLRLLIAPMPEGSLVEVVSVGDSNGMLGRTGMIFAAFLLAVMLFVAWAGHDFNSAVGWGFLAMYLTMACIVTMAILRENPSRARDWVATALTEILE